MNGIMRRCINRVAVGIMACVLAGFFVAIEPVCVGDARAYAGDGGLALSATVLNMQAETEAGEYAATNGWKLAYKKTGEQVTITDVVSAGVGSQLTIPDVIDGVPVTAIGDDAFRNQSADDPAALLSEVVLPKGLKTFGIRAFLKSNIERVSIPASVEYLPDRCFATCEKLVDVSFEGASIGYLDKSAFNGCTSLVKITIPELTSDISGTETYRIGKYCFNRCVKLETVVFEGNVNTKSGRYIAASQTFEDCTSLKNLVYRCKRSTIPYGTGSDSTIKGVTEYQTLAFYASADDARNTKDMLYSATCADTTKISDILSHQVSEELLWDERGTFPELPAGKVWGVSDHALENPSSPLADTYYAIPVDADDLAYGWVTCDIIDDWWAGSATRSLTMYDTDLPRFYLDSTGVVYGLDTLAAYGADSTPIDPATYTLEFEKSYTVGSGSQAITGWTTVGTTVESVQEAGAGTYRAFAWREVKSEGGTSIQRTEYARFLVQVFTPAVVEYGGTDEAYLLGEASRDAGAVVSGKAKVGVVVPVSDWHYQLIGAGLAGVGDGVLLFDNGENYSTRSMLGYVASGAKAIEVVGATAVVPESAAGASPHYLVDYLKKQGYSNFKRYSTSASVQALADEVYAAVRKLQTDGNDVFGSGWGTVAIVASSDSGQDALPIAGYAYAQKAPVFFTGSDGLLSATDLGYLKEGGFEKIVMAGDASHVSAACATSIRNVCGIAPTRLFDQGDDSLGAVFGSLDEIGGSEAVAVIADASDPAAVTSASVLASTKGAAFYTCSCTADSKRIQARLRARIESSGPPSVEGVCLVGNFSRVDAGLRNRLAVMWESPLSAKIGTGDTVTSGELVYSIAASGKAVLANALSADISSAAISSFAYDGARYTVTGVREKALSSCKSLRTVKLGAGVAMDAVGKNAFANCTTLENVALGSGAGKIGQGAFSGCTALKTVTGSATGIDSQAFSGCSALTGCVPARTATSIGASAFAGCTSLAAVSASAATSIGSNAFARCTKLRSASCPKAKSVGEGAFSGCTALKAVSLASAQTLGKSSFSGCVKLASVALPKVKTVGASAFAGDKALKKALMPKCTSIGTSAFQGCAGMTSARFASTALSKIGAKAFYGCKKLKSLLFKTKKLTAARVGAKAFSGMPAKAQVKVPKAKMKAYKKLFVKKGLSKKATVKAA